MKTLILTTCLVLVSLSAEARKVTFFQNGPATNELEVADYETFTITSAATAGTVVNEIRIWIEKDGTRFWLPVPTLNVDSPHAAAVVQMVGPARIQLIQTPGQNYPNGRTVAWLTVDLQPETYEVNKSVTIAPGNAGAAITLESSTNLIAWSSATNGVYTNVPAATFFRIKAERIP